MKLETKMDFPTQMVKAGVCEKTSHRKGGWSPEEDEKLIAYINRYGIWNWNQMTKPAGLLRSGKSCRLRWMNYLRPGVKRGNFSQEEDEIILKLHEELGNRWSTIASRLPGRTDNEIKNYWHTRLNKRLKNNRMLSRKATTESKKKNPSEVDFLLPNSPKESNKDGYKGTPMFSPLSTEDFSSSSSDTSGENYESQTKSENIGSSETYGQLQSSIKTTFPTLESFDMAEGYGTTNPGFIVPTSEGVISDTQTLPMEGSDMVEAFGATDPGFMVSNWHVGFSDDQLQRLLEQPFPAEAGLEMLEGYGVTDPGFMVSTSHVCELQEYAHACASYYDGGNDLWPYFLES